MNDITENTNFFFVSLGRETGGLLEMLDLPASADEMTVQGAAKDYRKGLETDFKTKRAEIRPKLKNHEITQEQFDEQVKAWEEEWNDKLAEFNAIKESFDLKIGSKRGLSNQGIIDDSLVWYPMLEHLRQNRGALWYLLWRYAPTPQFTNTEGLIETINQAESLVNTDSLMLATSILIKRIFLGELDGNCAEVDGQKLYEMLLDPDGIFERLLAGMSLGTLMDKIPEQWQAELHSKLALAEIRIQISPLKDEQSNIFVPNITQFLVDHPKFFWWLVSQVQTDSKLPKFKMSQKRSRAKRCPTIPHSAFMLRHKIEARQAAELFVADLLWQGIKYTNRDDWQFRIAEWIDAVSQIKLRWTDTPQALPIPIEPLQAQYSHYIEELTREAILETPTLPVVSDAAIGFEEKQRAWGETQEARPGAAMQAFFEELMRRRRESEKQGATQQVEPSREDLLRLLLDGLFNNEGDK